MAELVQLIPFGVTLLAGGVIGFVLKSFSQTPKVNTPTCSNITIPTDRIISMDKAKQMYDSYTNRRISLIEAYENTENLQYQPPLPPFNATVYGEWSFAEFKNYCEYLSCISEELNISNEGDGIKSIRIYMANYGDDTNQNYINKNTFMMLPTRMFGGQEEGFAVKDFNTTNSVSTASITAINDANSTLTGFTSLIFNEANLRPPPPQTAGTNDFN